jgi:hypothetical protein
MGQIASVRFRYGLWKARVASLATLGSAFLLGVTMPAAPAMAQQADGEAVSAQVKPAPICTVRTNDAMGPAQGSARPVMAICGTHGLLLGYADSFEVFRNESLQAVLVDMRRGEDRSILLISLQGDRPPLLEDISGQISMAADRGPIGSLEGLDIDVAGFVQGGTVDVRGRSETSEAAKAGTIDLQAQIAQARTARGVLSARK